LGGLCRREGTLSERWDVKGGVSILTRTIAGNQGGEKNLEDVLANQQTKQERISFKIRIRGRQRLITGKEGQQPQRITWTNKV